MAIGIWPHLDLTQKSHMLRRRVIAALPSHKAANRARQVKRRDLPAFLDVKVYMHIQDSGRGYNCTILNTYHTFWVERAAL